MLVCLLLSFWLASTATLFALAQFLSTPTDHTHTYGNLGIPVRYKEVPSGICESRPGVKSFTGYVDISKEEHMFFWFFETRHGDPTKAPLTVWINGGQAGSSLIGLFQSNGPCRLFNNGTLVDNSYSWTAVSNVLYVDQPVGVGLSYSQAVPGYLNPNLGYTTVVLPSNECPEYAQGYRLCGTYPLSDVTSTANSTQAAAPTMWKALQGFMGAFPQYSRNSFHFAAEDYGGHFAPVFNEYFMQQNEKKIKGAQEIRLESVTINSGWFDPLIQYSSYYNYSVDPGNPYDINVFNQSAKKELYNNIWGRGMCVDQMKRCLKTGRADVCGQADTFCIQYVELPFDLLSHNRDESDIRQFLPNPFPYHAYQDYLNSPNVQKALSLMTNYTDVSVYVTGAFATTADDGREGMTIESIRSLLARNVSVTLWAGDADYIYNWLGIQAVAEEVGHVGYQEAGFAALQTSDGVHHGDVRQSGRFSFSRIFEAGSKVAFYQPLASLELFERTIKGLDIATGKIVADDAYRTSGPKQSTYHQGNRTVQKTVLPDNSTYNVLTNIPDVPS